MAVWNGSVPLGFLQAGLLATAVAMLLWQKRLVYVFTCGERRPGRVRH
jgi:hypothetical protein